MLKCLKTARDASPRPLRAPPASLAKHHGVLRGSLLLPLLLVVASGACFYTGRFVLASIELATGVDALTGASPAVTATLTGRATLTTCTTFPLGGLCDVALTSGGAGNFSSTRSPIMAGAAAVAASQATPTGVALGGSGSALLAFTFTALLIAEQLASRPPLFTGKRRAPTLAALAVVVALALLASAGVAAVWSYALALELQLQVQALLAQCVAFVATPGGVGVLAGSCSATGAALTLLPGTILSLAGAGGLLAAAVLCVAAAVALRAFAGVSQHLAFVVDASHACGFGAKAAVATVPRSPQGGGFVTVAGDAAVTSLACSSCGGSNAEACQCQFGLSLVLSDSGSASAATVTAHAAAAEAAAVSRFSLLPRGQQAKLLRWVLVLQEGTESKGRWAGGSSNAMELCLAAILALTTVDDGSGGGGDMARKRRRVLLALTHAHAQLPPSTPDDGDEPAAARPSLLVHDAAPPATAASGAGGTSDLALVSLTSPLSPPSALSPTQQQRLQSTYLSRAAAATLQQQQWRRQQYLFQQAQPTQPPQPQQHATREPQLTTQLPHLSSPLSPLPRGHGGHSRSHDFFSASPAAMAPAVARGPQWHGRSASMPVQEPPEVIR